MWRWGLLLAACGGADPEPPAAMGPGPLQVGVGRARIPAPVGIGTAGFGGFTVGAPKTPFAEIYPGTQHIHGHPDLRAMAISRGEGHTVIFLRTDTVGVFQQLRSDVVDEVAARTGRSDIDDALIIGATHTHSGPGRVIDAGGPFELIADRFLPEFYERLVDAMADAVVGALDDLGPGRVGVAFADGSAGIDDRRCEDGLTYVNGEIPLLLAEKEGEVVGLLMAYAIHGTVHGIEELTLSQDVAGGVELAVADRFDHPVQVMMFNAWGADMSPADPEVPRQAGPALAAGVDRIAAVGAVTADAVQAALADVVWEDAPEVTSRTLRAPIDRDTIGYDDDTFPYEYGAVYCNGDSDCDPATVSDGIGGCLPFTEEYPAPNQTEFGVGRVGPLYLVTFPGEPGTLLAERVIADVSPTVDGSVMFLGYSQDYLGYSILEDDWWQGGYEASGALWGPRQGEHLADAAVAAFAEVFGGAEPVERPERLAGFRAPLDATYSPVEPLDFGTILVQPSFVDDTLPVVVTVAGGDPWLGAPRATVLVDGAPLLRPNGEPLHSDLPAMRVSLEVDPPWSEPAGARQFRWTFQLARQSPVVGASPTLAGDVQLEIELPTAAGGVEIVRTSIVAL